MGSSMTSRTWSPGRQDRSSSREGEKKKGKTSKGGKNKGSKKDAVGEGGGYGRPGVEQGATACREGTETFLQWSGGKGPSCSGDDSEWRKGPT